MKNIKEALICGLLIASIGFVLQLGYLANRAEESLSQLDSQLYYQNMMLIRMEAQTARAIATMASDVHQARLDLRRRSAEFSFLASQALQDMHDHLAAANSSLQGSAVAWVYALDRAASAIEAVAGPAGQIESQVSSALELSFDCVHQSRDSNGAVVFEGNPDCFHNRFVGAARGIEQAAKAWGDAAPRQAQAATGLLEHGAQAAEHTEAIARDLANQPPLWFRALKLLRRLRPW